MKTAHQFVCGPADRMETVPDESIALVVTSPPYPMIEMWDDCFGAQNSGIRRALLQNKPDLAFEKMHRLLDAVWHDVFRVIVPGGFACINIGDAVRTFDERFMLYPNHARVLTGLLSAGFTPLPLLLWRKQTNAPNKFMGSGMLPAGAYVTLEHETVLIVRKGGKRRFETEADKQNRYASAIFWEERNQWYSDVWMDLKGARQQIGDGALRRRSGAFPFELPYRLINMYSVKGDTVLDPFCGVGTTLVAAAAAGRHSIGYDLEAGFGAHVEAEMKNMVGVANRRIRRRLTDHGTFVEDRLAAGKAMRYRNRHYGFPVVTAHEKELLINAVLSLECTAAGHFDTVYDDRPQEAFCGDWPEAATDPGTTGKTRPGKTRPRAKPIQQPLID